MKQVRSMVLADISKNILEAVKINAPEISKKTKTKTIRKQNSRRKMGERKKKKNKQTNKIK